MSDDSEEEEDNILSELSQASDLEIEIWIRSHKDVHVCPVLRRATR